MKKIKIPKIKNPKIRISSIVSLLLLILVSYIAFQSRISIDTDLVLDYDPWWQYRYAKEILENDLIPLKWDILSFFPPGRPFSGTLGWEYTMIFVYKILSIFSSSITFMKAAILSPAILVALSAVSAFLFGRELTNKWGGLVTSIIAPLTPAFMAVSMAGYCDTDAVVVFYSFLTLFTTFLAMRKGKIPYIILALVTNFLFIYSWWFGWYILFFFLLLIPSLFVLRFLEKAIEKKFKIDVQKTAMSVLNNLKKPMLPILIILLVLNSITIPLGFGSVFDFIKITLGFASGESMLVNVSVAELQPISIFKRSGFNAVMGRVGFTVGGSNLIQKLFENIGILLLLFLPAFILYKFFKKKEIRMEELFILIWEAATFYSILHGVRFSLMFSCAVAATAGYTVGKVIEILRDKKIFYQSTVFGFILFFIIFFLSTAMSQSQAMGGMKVGQNWVDMLNWLKENADPKAIVATWWDPGHIIAGYTGLRVHADGAHCAPTECIPYNHNIRIQNMGRIMSTSDEEEAVSILKKYIQLTPEQCKEVKDTFGDIVPDEACEPASEMYFISSNDLIGKFTWMNYFGGYRSPINSQSDFISNPGVCCASTPDTESGQLPCGEFADQGKGVWIWCPWIFSNPEVQQDQEGNNVYVYDYSGLKMAIIQKPNQLIPVYNNRYIINHMTFFSENGTLQMIDLSGLDTSLEKIDGMIWVDPGFRSLIYFAPAIKDSVFVKTFFYNGEGLEHFKLVYSNSEIRLYKVVF